ncbi:MAG: TonB-dependent receptor [Calditrichia bacterium]
MIRTLQLSLLLLCFLGAQALATGVLKGKVTSLTGEEIVGANVVVEGSEMGAATNATGEYMIDNVPAGTYVVSVSYIGYKDDQRNVTIADGQTAMIDFRLAEESVAIGGVLVYGASRKLERITDAPAAVSVIPEIELKRYSATGQAPLLFDSEPGVDLVQNGMSDFNLNTRGFNSSLNRRVLVLVDNRQPATAFLGNQEWNGLSKPLDDLGSIEMIRGPGSALYGANAYTGVVNITTPSPRDIVGTRVSFSAGEKNSFGNDFRTAEVLGNWSYKFNIGYKQSGTWSQSRNLSSSTIAANEVEEYSTLSPEAVPLDESKLRNYYGSARLDYDFQNSSYLSFETGMAQGENEVAVTGLGRVQITESFRPFWRTAYTAENLFFQVDYTGRTTGGPTHQRSLSSGASFEEDSDTYNLQAQTNFDVMDEKVRFVAGVSQRFQSVDTRETLTPDDYFDNQTGIYGQVDIKLGEMISLVGAARVDRSTLHDTEFSPKAAIVFSPSKSHSFRGTFNKAFQTPNYSELYLRAPAGLPVNLAPLEAGIEAGIENALGLPPGSIDLPLNFGVTPVLALGNEDLEVEKVTGFEFGYKGIISNKFFLTADVYFNQLDNFVTDLLPGVNPTYPTYTVPAGINPAFIPSIEAGIAAALGPNAPLFSTLPDGSQALVVSYANEGEVEERGVEIGANFYVTDELLLSGNMTYFDFEVLSQAAGDDLLPNTPETKFNVGASYTTPNWDASVRAKYVSEFDWAAGVFSGTIPSYATVNVTGGYNLTDNTRIGLVVTNLLNNEHIQLFGGSVIGRRALANISFNID